MWRYQLRLGLPHTNARGLSEPLLLMHAGHFHWTSIATAISSPLSRLRTLAGGKVYATFYFIELVIPEHCPLESFGLDDDVEFLVALRAFKNVSVEGQIMLDRPGRLPPLLLERETPILADVKDAHPWIHFGNIFITPVQGNNVLRVAPPANADFSGLPPLPNAENPYHITKAAAESGTLGLLGDQWTEVGAAQPFELTYRIDPDRDTNGAGLVYFANYVSFLETAERQALGHLDQDLWAPAALVERSLRRRRIAYYGNVNTTDAVSIQVRVFAHAGQPTLLGFRYAVHREQDSVLICLSESVKAVASR